VSPGPTGSAQQRPRQGSTDGEEFVLRILIKNIVHDLHGINQPDCTARTPFQGSQRLRLMPTAGKALVGATRRSSLPNGHLPAGIRPGVELNDVEIIQAQIFETYVHVLLNVFGREAIVEGKLRPAGQTRFLGGIFVAT